jgi:hypothetical protein
MNRRHPEKGLIAILLMLSVVITTGSFAYWSSTIEGTETKSISHIAIGAGNNVKTSALILPNQESSFGHLVPAGQVENSIGLVTDKVDFLYQMNWQEQQTVFQTTGEDIYGEITVSISYEIFKDNDPVPLNVTAYIQIYDLILVTEYNENPTQLLLNNPNPSEFGFSVSMNEPLNQLDYDIISNSTIVFYFDFQIKTSAFDLNLDFTEISMEQLIEKGTTSPKMEEWNTEISAPLAVNKNSMQKFIFFPITDDEYTLTVNAQLSDVFSKSGGYGILFDTSFDNEDSSRDNGYVLQFDRGYANGEMIIRSRVNGQEQHPFWREQSNAHNYFPSKMDNPEWWVAVHEVTIDISNLDDTTRLAKIYIDETFIGSTTYSRIENDSQMYVGLRVWGSSPTDFYHLSVD